MGTQLKPQDPRPVMQLVKQAPRKSLAERGRLMGIEELQQLLPPYQGKPRTRWWLNHSFLPEKRVKIGRDSGWWECDVLEYLDANTGVAE